MFTIITLTKKQLATLESDCKTVLKVGSSRMVDEYYQRQVRLLDALHECHGLGYSDHRKLKANLDTAFAESMKFARLNDELAEVQFTP